MAAGPDCAPLPARPSTRCAAPSASPCRPSSRRCRPPPEPRLWCLKLRMARKPLIINVVQIETAEVGLKERKAFCFMSGPDEEAVRKAHEAVHLPFDPITEVKRVTGADLRHPVDAQTGKAAA